MTLEKWVHDPNILGSLTHFLKGHGGSRYERPDLLNLKSPSDPLKMSP